jgi:uncharacterized protein (DUF58 family)
VRGWGLIAAAVLTFVLTQVFRRQELAYLACFLVALPVYSLLWVTVRRFSLSVRRRFSPESGAVGQSVTAMLFVQNWNTLRTPTATWSEGASAPLRPSDPAVLPPLPGFVASSLDTPSPRVIRYRVDTRFRGAHAIGPFSVTVADPFGCAVRRMAVGTTDTVLVTPTVFELARVDLRLSTGDGAEQVSRRLVGAGEQDVIARKYLPGDSMRRVHWPATAKHGELMVRQDDQRNDQDAVILLDANSFARDGVGRDAIDQTFEWAVSTVASIALHLMNEGYGVRVVGHGAGAEQADVFTAPSGGPRVLRDLAQASRHDLGDPAAFRAAVEEASLTSPDAPPVFAVVSADRAAADRIRDLAALSSHPVAFVVGERMTRARAIPATGSKVASGSVSASGSASATAADLRGAGWSVIECAPHDELPVLWKALGEARGLT